jgi:hypothetical protein
MPDIAMCVGSHDGKSCPNLSRCYRKLVTPTPLRQVYINAPFSDEDGSCEMFVPLRPLTADERDLVVELLECAADYMPDGTCAYIGRAAAFLGSPRRVGEVALMAFRAAERELSHRTWAPPDMLLEAAQRVREGSWP